MTIRRALLVLASLPFVAGFAYAATWVWFERVWLPRIAGAEDTLGLWLERG